MNDKIRLRIAKKVRQLRQERRWTQVKLAHLLDLSQNRFSEIENGQGSFSAEQLIQILTTFNLPLDYFVEAKATKEDQLTNVLARLGAAHLQENPEIVATEKIKEVIDAACETIATSTSPRLITALAPVIVNCANHSILNQIRYKLIDLGLIHRYGWVLDNILDAVKNELYDNLNKLSRDLELKYKRTERFIDGLLNFPKFIPHFSKENENDIWGIDEEIASQKTFVEVKKHSSAISKKWGIVTRIQKKDFVDALRHSFDY